MYLIHSPILSNNQISSTNGDDTFNAAHTILKGHYFCNQKNIDYWVQKCTKMLSSCDVTQSFMYIQCRLYNVLVWSEKMNTMQFFPNEMKNKISIVIPFLYILKIILKPFCILFFFLVRIIMGPDRPILPIDDVVMFLLLKETGACCSVIQL